MHRYIFSLQRDWVLRWIEKFFYIYGIWIDVGINKRRGWFLNF
jgi:hypothetical protein